MILTLHDIEIAVVQAFKVWPSALKGDVDNSGAYEARLVFSYLAAVYTKNSFEKIGACIGREADWARYAYISLSEAKNNEWKGCAPLKLNIREVLKLLNERKKAQKKAGHCAQIFSFPPRNANAAKSQSRCRKCSVIAFPNLSEAQS